jgi:hypothetical protein
MPKTNQAGATYDGHEGLVTDGEGKVSELDPSRNPDGSVVDGYESDERELKDRAITTKTTSGDADDKEASPSDGNSFSASSRTRASGVTKTSGNRR